MNILSDIVNNPWIQVAVISWAIAQSIKFITILIKYKRFDFERIFGAGGMPSAHSALVTSMATGIGLTEGFNSPIFAACLAFALITMYDAAGVRRAAGKQARVLNQIVAAMDDNDQVKVDKKLKELLGHTPIEVFCGALLGLCIAIIRFL
ncbi:MAG: divergent PAP2 family protein [Clostridia bacterium]|nr:divergent PAP2 family protein [Clostridia bacterium]